MEEVKINRSHKSSFFTSLFGEKERLLELYNALEGTSYDDPDLIDINTLSDVFFLNRQNDISFTIAGKIVVLIEHQSSINENLPIRLLLYISRVYEKIIDVKDIYKRDLIKVPRPEFIVLYNGVDKFPDEKVLKLSDAFEELGVSKEVLQLELQVRVLNINKGVNPGIERKSETLSGYSEFVFKVREFEGNGFPLEEAIIKAINYCMERNILLDYLREHASEVVNMLYYEFNMEDALAARYAEGEAKGVAIGEAKGVAIGEARGVAIGEAKERSYIKSLVKQGFSQEELLKKLEENI